MVMITKMVMITLYSSRRCFETLKRMKFTSKESELLKQSYEAFTEEASMKHSQQREADALNGLVVSDSDVEGFEQYTGELNVIERLRETVARRRKSICRRARYLQSKLLAERNYLGRRRSKAVKGIVKQFPDIGSVIETFIQDRNVGADK